ncbi:MAG: ISAs1 family transposase, partial [Candidatus Rhabdochlamydia sp.]
MSKKNPREFYSEIDRIADKEAFIESIQEGFKDIKDPRLEDNQTYHLLDLLIIILTAILAGANTIIEMHTYAQVKIGMFKRLLKIETAPSYNVFWWLLTRLNPRQIESCFVDWIQSLPDEDKNKLIAIDGKHIRGAGRNKKIHLVSAWDSNRSLLLGQVKANEITA